MLIVKCTVIIFSIKKIKALCCLKLHADFLKIKINVGLKLTYDCLLSLIKNDTTI